MVKTGQDQDRYESFGQRGDPETVHVTGTRIERQAVRLAGHAGASAAAAADVVVQRKRRGKEEERRR